MTSDTLNEPGGGLQFHEEDSVQVLWHNGWRDARVLRVLGEVEGVREYGVRFEKLPGGEGEETVQFLQIMGALIRVVDNGMPVTQGPNPSLPHRALTPVYQTGPHTQSVPGYATQGSNPSLADRAPHTVTACAWVCHTGLEPQSSRQGPTPTHSLRLTVSLGLGRRRPARPGGACGERARDAPQAQASWHLQRGRARAALTLDPPRQPPPQPHLQPCPPPLTRRARAATHGH